MITTLTDRLVEYVLHAYDRTASTPAPGDDWTSCDTPPPTKGDPWEAWHDSEWLLVRTRNDKGREEVHIGKFRQYNDEFDGSEGEPDTCWVMRGRDGYELEDVKEWRRVPA